MGRGRKPIPDVIKLERGTLQAEQMRFQPPTDDKIPECPLEEGSIAFEKWVEVTTGLKRLGLIDSLDRGHIEAYCIAYQTAKEAEEEIRKQGMILTAANGNAMKNPACTVAAEAWGRVRHFGNELGLCWVARTKMNSGKPKEKPKDKGAKYLA